MHNFARHTNKKSWLIIVGLLLLCCFLLLEITHVVDFYTKSPKQTQAPPETSQVSIDYSPASQEEKPTLEQKKQDNLPSAFEPRGKNIDITISAAGQDETGGDIIVRTILQNATGGVCKVTLSRDGQQRTYSAAVVWQGNYFSCDGFRIPYLDLGNGIWQLSLVATQEDAFGEATQTISVTGE